MTLTLLKIGGLSSNPLCIARVLSVIAFFSYLAYAGFGLWKGNFHLSEYASGLMEVLGGCAALLVGQNLTKNQ